MNIFRVLLKQLINIPFVLKFAQDFLGANQLKNKIYATVFDPEQKGTLLDFGCSYGNTTKIFKNFDYYGIDIDCQAINAAKRQFKDYPNTHFYCLDILRQDFKVNFFDHILFASTSHHMSDEVFLQVLDKLMLNLKPGGKIHFFDIYRKPDDKFITRLLTRFDQGKFIRPLEAYDKLLKERAYNLEQWQIYRSPDHLIKLWDFLYVRLSK